MPATDSLCNFIGIDLSSFSKKELILLEAYLLERICEELKEIFRMQHQNFSRFIHFNTQMENEMLEGNFLCLVIKDILSTGEYTIEGIAEYTDIHCDVIHEVITGKNPNPSAAFLRKIIALHRSVRRYLYDGIIKNV